MTAAAVARLEAAEASSAVFVGAYTDRERSLCAAVTVR